MRILDLNELKSSDYVLLLVLKVNDRLTGYTMVDKAFVKAIKDPSILDTIKKAVDEGYIMKLDLTITCPENDQECIQRARALGVEPGKETIGLLGIVALPVTLLDIERLREVLQTHFGELYDSLTAWYCTKDELTDVAAEFILQVKSYLINVDEERLAKMTSELEHDRVIVLNPDLTYSIVST